MSRRNEMVNNYAYFVGKKGIAEFEISSKCGTFFWTRGRHLEHGQKNLTKTQSYIKEEEVGDIAYIVVSKDIAKDLPDTKGVEKPVITYKTRIVEVINMPSLCYGFIPKINGKNRSHIILPLELIETVEQKINSAELREISSIDLRSYADEIQRASKISQIIRDMKLSEDDFNVTYYDKNSEKDQLFLKDQDGKYYVLNEDGFKRIDINNYSILSVVKMFSKETMEKILNELEKNGSDTNWKLYLKNVKPWFTGNANNLDKIGYVKAEITKKIMKAINENLNQGMFTMQLIPETSNKTVKDIINVLGDELKNDEGPQSELNQPVVDSIKDDLKDILKMNKQVVLTGAPGTGKTYLADTICKELIAENLGKTPMNLKYEEIKRYILKVQFHQSYDYTDFVEGLRPVQKGSEIVFERKDGIFMELCRKAIEDNSGEYYLIIDEINRADLSRVFGELMYCLEYRGEDGRIRTQYNNLMDDSDPFKAGFYVPKNVYLVATMNEIDRSVDVFDFALRRRFFWCELKANDVMEDVVRSTMGNIFDEHMIREIINSAKKLNDAISSKGKEYGLNEHYHIGPAYYGNIDKKWTDMPNVRAIKEKIWKYRLEPILREYVRGYEDVENFVNKLKKEFFDETDNQMTQGQKG